MLFMQLFQKKAQTRKALKIIYPSIPQQYYPQGIQGRAITNIVARDVTITKKYSIVVERMKYNQNTFLYELYSMNYTHLHNFNIEVKVNPFPPLLQILMSLRSHRHPTKQLFMTIQQTYDDELFTVSYIVEVSQEEATILLVLSLLLKGRLGIKVDKSFR